MKRIIIPLFSLLLVSCGSGSSENASGTNTEESSSTSDIPTEQDIINAMNKQYTLAATSDPGSGRRSIELHSIKIGTTDEPNIQDLKDGVPDKSKVTMAKIEYTYRTHYNEITKAYRETGTFKVYRDNFGEWIPMRDGTTGTVYFDEPANP